VRSAAQAFRRALADAHPQLQLVGGEADAASPVLHLRLQPQAAVAPDPQAALGALRQVAAELAAAHGVLVAVPQYSSLEARQPQPSIKLCVHAGLAGGDAAAAVAQAVRGAARSVLGAGAEKRK
jgi:hypothetical protein